MSIMPGGKVKNGGTTTNEDPRFTEFVEEAPKREVFVQDENGEWVGTGMLMLSDNTLLAPEGFGAESGSVKFGDLINLSEASGYLAIYNYLEQSQYQMVDYHVPKDTASSKPTYIWLYEAQNEFVAQPDSSVQLNANPLVFNYTTALQSRVNQIVFKAYAAMTNVRVKVTDTTANVVVKYYPSKSSWEGNSAGVDFVVGDNFVDFGDSPLLFSPGTTLKYEITADTVSISGNASGVPYVAGMVQRGEIITLADQKDIAAIQANQFSGNYNDLSNKPTIPTNTNQLINGSGYVTASQAATSSPVQSVNGQVGAVTIPIPAGQVNTDWNSNSGVSQLLNKPILFSGAYADLTGKPVLFSGNYTDLTNKPVLFDGTYASLTGKPTIPAAQIQSDWNQTTTTALDYIKNKPVIPTVSYPVTSVNTKTGAVVLTNTDVGAAATNHTHAIADVTNLQTALNGKFNSPTGTTAQYLRGDGSTATFPTIPSTQVNSDWSATTGIAQILNKPTTVAGYGITDAVSQASLTTSLSGYATTSALTSGLAAKFNTPAGATIQYVRGDGSLATFPTIPTVPTLVSAFTNDSGYLTSVSSAQISAALGYTPYNSTNPNGYVTQSGARAAVSLTTTGNTGAATYNSTTGILNVPNYSVPARTFTNPTRPLNTAFQISTTQDVQVTYAVDITVSALLIGGSSGRVYLEYANEVGFTTGVTTVTSSGNSTGGVLSITNVGTANLSGIIPAGKFVRLRTVNVTATPTFAFQSAQEVLL